VRHGFSALATVWVLAVGAPAGADTLFWEDFDGYTSFPSQDPIGDYVNKGVPKPSEGSDEVWYGARFMAPDSACIPSSDINCDIAVQQFGNLTTNPTPVGRFEDEAGLLFSIDSTGFTDITLEFDWRTFSAISTDQLVVGYFVGDIPGSEFSTDLTADFQTGPYSWPNWVEISRMSALSTFTHELFALPSDVGTIWIAFWLDDGEGDYGKIDNVHVSATAIPEPSTALLVLAGLTALGGGRRR